MESHRQGNRVTGAFAQRQSGVTVIGFLILASLFGVVGLAAIKIFPMYMQNMRLSTLIEDVQAELNGKGASPATIQRELYKRISIEDIRLPESNVSITPGKSGFLLRIKYENRAPYVADISLVVDFDKQVEIQR